MCKRTGKLLWSHAGPAGVADIILTHGGVPCQMVAIVMFESASVHVLSVVDGEPLHAWICGGQASSAIAVSGNTVCIANAGSKTLSVLVDNDNEGFVSVWKSSVDTAHAEQVSHLKLTTDLVVTAAGTIVSVFKLHENSAACMYHICNMPIFSCVRFPPCVCSPVPGPVHVCVPAFCFYPLTLVALYFWNFQLNGSQMIKRSSFNLDNECGHHVW